MNRLMLLGYVDHFARDRLALAIIVATVVHAFVILGIGFGITEPDQPKQPPPNIEVTLVNTRSDIVPKDADYLAQANQEGGGNTEDRIRPETLFSSMLPKETPDVTSPDPTIVTPPPQHRATRDEVMTVNKSKQKMVADVMPEDKNVSKEVSAVELVSRSMEIASLEVEIGKSVQAYAKMPRKAFVSASTREHRYASYMDAWRRKVEKIGNLNFPAEAKQQHLSGDLLLDVVLRPDGTVLRIDVLDSSGHKILDDAAMRIVHLASPFAPFPDEIRKDVDELHITRTWKFIGGNRVLAQ